VLAGSGEVNSRRGEVSFAVRGCVMVLGKIEVMAVGGNFCGLRIDYRIFACGCFRREE
jgi:hypothetical protein